MSEVDLWGGWSTRLGEIATELGRLSDEKTGSTIRERRYKEYLKLGLQHLHIAEETAAAMSEEIECSGPQPRPHGPSPSSRLAMTVRFAADMLGWTARIAAANARITTSQYLLIRNGRGLPSPETVEKLFAALTRHGIDMGQLTLIVDDVLERRERERKAARVGMGGEAPSGGEVGSSGGGGKSRGGVETVYQPSATGDGDELPPPQWK